MQRLFTTFADGWPGFGLLVQRLAIGVALLHGEVALLRQSLAHSMLDPQAIGAALAVFILVGLWTPAASVMITAVEVWIVVVYPADQATAILLATFSVTLAMIGPGAFSIDARLFGRRHIAG